ncbi:MAG TPA: Fic family protein [Longimicrobium sp.]|nr:Fic family protein [Longimicrobium sp.]
MRAGRWIKQGSGYRAFIPAPLPPTPPVVVDEEMVRLLSMADRALGRLDGVASVLPNPNLFVAMYVRQEAVLSSQIEGTQSTLEDVIQFELGADGERLPQDVEEVVNYVRAMNHGLRRLGSFPLSLRLIRDIHADLMAGVRGSHRAPGEFRTSQNWIGAAGSTLQDASFVPPPVPEMMSALGNLEDFLHDRDGLPVLLHAAVAHAQFETIHPFLDGNGRVGRLLITFLLCEREVLQRPLLYLSHYLKAHRAEYYDRLTAIRSEGNWEGWLKFFLRGVDEVSRSATETARKILELRENHRLLVAARFGSTPHAPRLLDFLYQQPIVNVRSAERHLGCTYATANKLVEQFTRAGILHEVTGARRNRLYRYTDYLSLFHPDAPSGAKPSTETQAASQQTGAASATARA